MKRFFAKLSIKSIVSIAVLMILLLYVFVFSNILYEKANEKVVEWKPKGRIIFWDISLTTVSGSKYAFIDTITSEYSKFRSGVSIYFNKISERTPEETILNNIQNNNSPDIIRTQIGDYRANLSDAISDIETAQRLNERYLPYITNDYGDKIILDVCYDISVILINREILNSLNVTCNYEYFTKESFLLFLEEIELADRKNSYDTLSIDKKDAYSYITFGLSEKDSSFNEDYMLKVMNYSSDSESPYSDFYNGSSAVLCGSLSDAAYITRRQLAGKGFEFIIMNYPCEEKEFIFIKDITSYIFFDSKDENKNKVLCDFADYFLSEKALIYTQNLGKLCTINNEIIYDKYPYLAKFTNQKLVHYTYRDEFIKSLVNKYENLYQ